MASGTVVIGFLEPLTDVEGIARLRGRGGVAFAMESIHGAHASSRWMRSRPRRPSSVTGRCFSPQTAFISCSEGDDRGRDDRPVGEEFVPAPGRRLDEGLRLRILRHPLVEELPPRATVDEALHPSAPLGDDRRCCIPVLELKLQGWAFRPSLVRRPRSARASERPRAVPFPFAQLRAPDSLFRLSPLRVRAPARLPPGGRRRRRPDRRQRSLRSRLGLHR